MLDTELMISYRGKPSMDLLIVQLKAAIRRLLDAKGIRARVLDKVNRYGEVVIGVILEKPPGHAPPNNHRTENHEKEGTPMP
jgi:hypothetical protein